jgi:hypothetical protein
LYRGRGRGDRLARVAGVVLLAALAAPPAGAAAAELVAFELADQFDRAHTDAELRGRVALLVSSGRRGSRHQGEWVGRLRRALAGRDGNIVLVEVADLRGVPFFMRGSVKKKFPRDSRGWVLMDWRGSIARAYDLDPDLCTVLLFNRSGVLAHRASGGEPEPETLAALIDRLDAELASGE